MQLRLRRQCTFSAALPPPRPFQSVSPAYCVDCRLPLHVESFASAAVVSTMLSVVRKADIFSPLRGATKLGLRTNALKRPAVAKSSVLHCSREASEFMTVHLVERFDTSSTCI